MRSPKDRYPHTEVDIKYKLTIQADLECCFPLGTHANRRPTLFSKSAASQKAFTKAEMNPNTLSALLPISQSQPLTGRQDSTRLRMKYIRDMRKKKKKSMQ